MQKIFATVALVTATLIAGSAIAAGAKYEKKFIAPAMTGQLNLGKMAYDRFCAQCHGVNAMGSDKGPTFIHRVYHPGHHGDGSFFIAPKQGARAHHWKFGDMKKVEGVTDAQLKNIVAYVRAVQQANGLF